MSKLYVKSVVQIFKEYPDAHFTPSGDLVFDSTNVLLSHNLWLTGKEVRVGDAWSAVFLESVPVLCNQCGGHVHQG